MCTKSKYSVPHFARQSRRGISTRLAALTSSNSSLTIPAMTAIEMPLARQAVANAFGILLLLTACGWLLHLTVQCARQHWRTRKLQLAFEESKDPQRLLRKTLKTLAETPGIRVCRKKPSLRPH